MKIKRIGDFTLKWGESLCWDHAQQRLYFVDCVSKQLHWLDEAAPPLHSFQLPSMPTAVCLADGGNLVIALANGLNLVDVDAGLVELIAEYPDAMGKRANDACVDRFGNLITGTLTTKRGTGSYWWYSIDEGWRQMDDGITNANGPVVVPNANDDILVFADTPARKLYAYDYSAENGVAEKRRIYADISRLGGHPDGACGTSDGGVLSCIIGPGKLAHYTRDGLQDALSAGSEQPSDVAFGGENLDRLFIVSISANLGGGKPQSECAGALVEIEGSGLQGLKEKSFRL